MTEYEYPPGVQVIIQHLKTIGFEVRNERPPESPLPFATVHRVGGGEDEAGITDEGRYAILVFGSSQEEVDTATQKVVRRMKKLAFAGQEKVIIGGKAYFADGARKREERPIDNLDNAIPRRFFGTSLMYDVPMRIVAA
ncbi:tail terminator [Mycobacterium phage Thibault]|uniref:Tail terminator n=1 Tax=Mycobacterium phage Thibault TaxID=1052673 RepID=G1FG89_9CAUD|nr:tail terminator [Mycobacterium phage Thibault]AEJ93974.1 tail terminator [Mycobacterium phage Thibault]